MAEQTAVSGRQRRIADLARDLALFLASVTARELADITKAPTITVELPYDCVIRGEKITANIKIGNYDRAEYRLPGERAWHTYVDGEDVVFTAAVDGFLSVRAVNDFTEDQPAVQHSNPMRVIHPAAVNPYTFPPIDIGVLTGDDLAVVAADLHAARLDWLDYDPTATAQAALALVPAGVAGAQDATSSIVDLIASMQAVATEANVASGTVRIAPSPAVEDLIQTVRESVASLDATLVGVVDSMRVAMQHSRGAGWGP